MAKHFKISFPIRLKDIDANFHEGREKDATREKTAKLCERIGELQELLHANANHAVIILLQGLDTAGKDGAVRKVLQNANPAGVETSYFKVPSAEEQAHDYLWRIHKAVPRYGNLGVFNRSHYEDVLVVRVMKLQPPSVWKARYAQINAFEKHLAENRVILLKFYLHISKDEQAERLQARLDDPSKNWKFVPADLEVRKYWDDYQAAYQDALNHCSTHHAPWHVVPANHKWYRDYAIAGTVVKTLEGLKMKWPKPHRDLSKFKVV
jgi:PPK2 family polyphosphate:nucleotide phosphotransferase